MNRLRRIPVLAIGFLSTAGLAMGWNRAGHMVTGAIAYEELQKISPKTAANVVSLLKEHPHFATMWKPQIAGLSGEEQDRALFMLAARWPDDIRGDAKFDNPTWHYINHPYKPKGQPSSVQVAQPAAVNITTAFQQNAKILASPASNAEKAVALCWIFHLTGDGHQPLHSVSLFTVDYPIPEGDRGGTRFYIRPATGAATKSLHAYWDDVIILSEQLADTGKRATALRIKPEHARNKLGELKEKKFESWIKKESYKLAAAQAYRNGTLKGSKDAKDGAVLPDKYGDVVLPVAERRVVLAGYRLADFLKERL